MWQPYETFAKAELTGTGIITSTWQITWSENGDIAAFPPGGFSVFGQTLSYWNRDITGDETISVTSPCTSAGTLDFTAVLEAIDDTPGGEYSQINLPLLGPPITPTPEPGTLEFGLADHQWAEDRCQLGADAVTSERKFQYQRENLMVRRAALST